MSHHLRQHLGLQKFRRIFLWNGASKLNRHQLDLYLSYGARSCADRELRVPALDRRENELRTISISLVGTEVKLKAAFHKNSFGIFRGSIFAQHAPSFY